MAPTPVVTCFLRHRDDVLLVRRSDAVGSYRGRWGAVSGHVAADGTDPETLDRGPLAAARAEIAEETWLLDRCELVRAGDPFRVDDADGRHWRVHPFLFDCDARAVEPNDETAEFEWVPPTEILRRETVPNLWRSYDRVRPTVETVATDREHGSAYLSVRALDVLRDRAGELAAGGDRPSADAWNDLADLVAALLDARPGMAVIRNRVNRAMTGAAERTAGTSVPTPQAVEESAQRAIERSLTADEDAAAAAAAAERIAGTVLTLSRSGTVLAALRRADLDGVVVAESRPGGEGIAVAETLADEGVDVTLIADAAVAHHLATADVDAVLVGADAVLADGRVVNKVGTRAAALAAEREGVPFYAVAARDKVRPVDDATADDAGVDTGAGVDADAGVNSDADPELEAVDPAVIYGGAADLRVETPLFDVTPADLVEAAITEDGTLGITDVERIAAEHRALADWRGGRTGRPDGVETAPAPFRTFKSDGTARLRQP